MKKMSLTGLLCGLILLTHAQSGFNVFTQNIHFIPEPSALGFLCGTTPQVDFTMGLTTQDDASNYSSQPVKIKIELTGFEFLGSANAVVSGSYAAHFTWAYDALQPNILLGTQVQVLEGTGNDPLFPNPASTGNIRLQLKVPSTLSVASLLKVDATTIIPSYMTSTNSVFDDNESTQTQVYCSSVTGCEQAPLITSSSKGWFCEGSNIILKAEGSAGSTFTWITPSTCSTQVDNSQSGSSSLLLQNLQSNCNGMIKVVQQKAGCNLVSDTAYFPVQVSPKPEVQTVSTACSVQLADITVTATPSNLLYAINGGVFQSNPVLHTDLSSAFTVEVKIPGTDCITFYHGNCADCLSANACPQPAKDSLVAPAVACSANPIALTGYFSQADAVYWESSGNGQFSNTSCTTSPCTVYYTPSASDKQRGYVSILLKTNDPDSSGACYAARCVRTIQLIDQLVAPNVTSNSPICEQTNLHLDVSGALGEVSILTPDGLILTGEHILRESATLAMSGVYTATLQAAGCASKQTNLAVQINALPNLQIQTQSTPEFCAGHANGSLAVQVSGGSGNYTICANQTSCTQNDSAVFNHLAPGLYTITVNDALCPDYAFSHLETIQSGAEVSPPSLSSSELSLCEHEPLFLQASSASGTTIVWTKYHDLFYNSGQTVSLGAADLFESGCYYARALDAQGCASPAVSLNVNVLEVPVITSVDVHCNQNQAELNVYTSLGTWLYSLDGISYQSSAQFQNVLPGNYTLHVKNGQSTCEATWPVEVPNCACGIPMQAISNLPTIACTYVAIPLGLTFTGSSSAQWFSSGNGTFQNASGASPLNTIYIPSSNDFLQGEVILTVVLADPDSSGPCTALSSQHKLLLRDSLETPHIVTSTTYCEQDTISLVASNDQIPLHWFTPTGPFLNTSHIQIAPAGINHTGWYLAEATGFQCLTKTDSVWIDVNAAPVLSITASKLPEVCKGNGNGQIELIIQGGSGFYQVHNVLQQNYVFSQSPLTYTWLSPADYIFEISDSVCVHAAYQQTVHLPEGFAPMPPVSASYNAPVCEGEDLILSATGPTGTYLWTDMLHPFSDTGKILTLHHATPKQSSTYKVQRVENGCASDYLLVTTHIFGEPVITLVDTFCAEAIQGGKIQIQALVTSGDSLEYSLNNSPYQSSNLFENLANGTYQVKVRTVGSDCEVSRNVDLYCHCTCNKEAQLTVFPVPNQGEFHVSTELYEAVDIAIIRVYDMSGRIIYEEVFEPKDLHVDHPVSIKQITKGNYKVQLLLDGKVSLTQSLPIID